MIPRVVTPRDADRPFAMRANAVQYAHPVPRGWLARLIGWLR